MLYLSDMLHYLEKIGIEVVRNGTPLSEARGETG